MRDFGQKREKEEKYLEGFLLHWWSKG